MTFVSAKIISEEILRESGLEILVVKILGAECTTRVLSGEKDTEFEKRSYLSGIVALSAIFSSFPGPGVVWRRACELLFIVPCKQQGTSVLVFRVYG